MSGLQSCGGQCPVTVNVPPDSRPQFLEVYRGRYLRTMRDYPIGSLEFIVPALLRIARSKMPLWLTGF